MGNGYNFFTTVTGIERMFVGYGNVMFVVAGKSAGELEWNFCYLFSSRFFQLFFKK
jgi:hypothetical protein